VAEHFEQQVDLGRRPEQCGRIWIHTQRKRMLSRTKNTLSQTSLLPTA
jgi:hypothetical protein